MSSKFRLILIALSLMSSYSKADIIGAGIGSLIGSQFGQGHGKIAMLALGAVVGDRISEEFSEPRQNTFRSHVNHGYDEDETSLERRSRSDPRSETYESPPVFVAEPVRVTVVIPGRAYPANHPYQANYVTNYVKVYPTHHGQRGLTVGAYRTYGGYGGYGGHGRHPHR
jgi:hypothetical protein